MIRKALGYHEYLASNVWRCEKSPNGAHYWREIQPNPDGGVHTGIFVCQYCFDSKKMPVYWSRVDPTRKDYLMED